MGLTYSVTFPCATPHPHKDELFTRIVVLVAVFPLLVDVNMFRLYNYIILNAYCVCGWVGVCVGGEGGGAGNSNLQYRSYYIHPHLRHHELILSLDISPRL